MSRQLLTGRIPANCFPFRWKNTPPSIGEATWRHCWHAWFSTWFITPEIATLYFCSWHLTRAPASSEHRIFHALSFEKGDDCWHANLDQPAFIIFHDGFYTSPLKYLPNFPTLWLTPVKRVKTGKDKDIMLINTRSVGAQLSSDM